MRTRAARYLKSERSLLYASGVVLRDPMLAEAGAPGPVVFIGSTKRAAQWCRDYGYFFNAPK